MRKKYDLKKNNVWRKIEPKTQFYHYQTKTQKSKRLLKEHVTNLLNA